jgi:type I restriction enzyme S subunit
VSNELPQGWIEATINEINLHKSQNITPSDFPEEEFELFSVPIFPTGKPENILGKDIGSSKQAVSPGDVLLCKINPRINRVWTVGEKANLRQIASSEWINIRNPLICANYLKYAFSKKDFRELLCSEVAGVGGSLTRAQPKKVEKYTVPIAPLNEQIRIADKLDSVLAKVDAAQARLEKIPTLLKRFRQSVLTTATSGELTREWREQTLIDNLSESELKSNIENEWFSSKQREFVRKNKVPKSLNWRDKVIDPNIEKSEVDTWFSLTLESIAEIIDPNPSHRMPNYVEDGVPFISSENIFGNDEIDFTVGKKITNDELKKQKERYEITNNSFAFTRIGTIGKSVKLALPHNYGISHAMAVVTPFDNLVNGQFLRLIMSCTSILQQASDGVQSVGVPDLGIGKMKNFRIPFPPMAEQNEIVRRIESLFAFIDTVEKQYLAAKKRIDRLSQSLLAKAFRGELVPQDPNDEPAAELLKRIQAERQQQATEKPKRKASARGSQNTIASKQTKTNTMQLKDAPENYLLELLAQLGGETHAEVLWKKSELAIDDFYAKLKQEMQANDIVEDKNSPDPALRKLKVANR